MQVTKIYPQEGFQKKFLTSRADIVFGGGSAGVGKSFALLMEPLRHKHNGNFGSVIFRRTMPMVKNEGGLWDTSEQLYMNLKDAPFPRPSSASWKFRSGASLDFSHLQYEKDKYNYQGSQIPFIGFDELTHFTESQFFYMMTRNRTTCGIKPYIRATTNPQGQGWVKNFIKWFIYPDDHPNILLRGLPIPERVGLLRYFTRFKGKLVWGNSPTDVLDQLPASVAVHYDLNSLKSFTFIPGTLDENIKLLESDPSYKASLLAQGEEDVLRLYKGSWAQLQDEDKKLYHYNALRDMFTNDHVQRNPSQRYMTADIALEGSDRFVICIWDGWRLEKIYIYKKMGGDLVLKTIREKAKLHRIPASNIAFDADGVGNTLKGFMKTSYHFNNGGKPLKYRGEEQRYRNLQTQCYFHLCNQINEWDMFVNVDNEVLQDQIVEELYAVERGGFDSRGKLCINPKDERSSTLGRSPDLADAIMMRSVFDFDGVRKKRRVVGSH